MLRSIGGTGETCAHSLAALPHNEGSTVRPAARLAVVVLTFAASASVPLVTGGSAAAAAPAQPQPVVADYNSDGRSDLAVGATRDLRAGFRAGAVFTRDSRTGIRRQHGISTTTERFGGSELGEKIASCDLNGDRYADLVASTTFDNPGEGTILYGIQVFLGSTDGLQTAGRLTERTTGAVPPVWALACGDVNGDGYDEIAVGDPNLQLNGKSEAGGVKVYRGGPTGPTTTGRYTLTQEYRGLPGSSETGDFFGAAVAFGDIDGDHFDDIVVGAPEERPAPTPEDRLRDGAVAVLYGSKTGLSTSRSAYLSGDRLKVTGGFGWAIALGDLTGDRKADLVVGAPEHLKGGNGIGAVAILRGRSGDLRVDQIITQADKGVLGASSPTNLFGSKVAVGDITGDRKADLVVAATGQDVSGKQRAGSITVLPGTSTGVDRARTQFLTRSTPGIAGSAARDDTWPQALTVLDTSGDGKAEVYAALSTDREKAVYQLPGSARGVVTSRAARLTQANLQPKPVSGLSFARSLG